jgi:hypothetical protein
MYKGKLKKGVVIDVIPYSQKKSSTEYAYIPFDKLKIWRDADPEEKLKIQETINIEEISRPKRLSPQPL